MKILKSCFLALIALLAYTAGHAQGRNGYKVNGITLIGQQNLMDDKYNIVPYAAVYVDAAANVYLCDRLHSHILKWSARDEVTSVFLTVDFEGVFIDNKLNIYYSSTLACISKYDFEAKKDIRLVEKADFLISHGIAADGNGNVYYTTDRDASVQKWAPGAAKTVTVAGGHGGGAGDNQLRDPAGVFVDQAGNVYVADWLNNRVQKWPPGARRGITVATVGRPQSVFVDASGNVFVSSETGGMVQKWPPGATEGLTVAGGNGDGNGASQLSSPTGIWLDAAGNLYVADNGNNRVQKFEKTEPNTIIPQPKPTEVIVHNEPVKPAPQVVKPDVPQPAPTVFTTLSWLEPVSNMDRLPGGVYSPEVASVPLSVRIISTAAIDASKIQLLLNGNALHTGSKMHVVDLKTIKTPVGANKKYEYLYTATATVPAGKSTLQVSYNDDATDMLPISFAPKGLNLYVLSVGPRASGLHYTQKDASDFADIFRNQQDNGKLFNQVQVETLLGEAATAVAISVKIAGLGHRDFTANDVLFIFISSHGYTTRDANGNDNLWITGSDFDDLAPEITSIDFKKRILDELAPINCKKFVFLDACHSGAGAKAAPGDIINAIQKMKDAGNNTTIITSSSGREESWEDNAWQNGAFTKAIREALTEKRGDADGNGVITMEELFDYLKKRIPELVQAAGEKDYGGHPVTQTPQMLNPKGDVPVYVY